MKFLSLHFFKNNWSKILSIIFFVALFSAYISTFAVFTPGQTLDPNCAPGVTGCNVSIQETLVSTTNIKTINGNSLLGSGDLTLSGFMNYPSAGIAVSTGSAWGTSITDNSANWNTAYGERNQWNGGSTGLVAATGRTSLGLGTAALSNTGDFVAYRTFGTAANNNTGDFVAYRTFGTAANSNVGDFVAYRTFGTAANSATTDFAPALVANQNYVTNAQLTVLGNTSNTNTGDETTGTIKTKLGAAGTGSDGYLTSTDWNTFSGKQDVLSSGTNIKTINGSSILGSGDLTISGSGISLTTTGSSGAATLVGSTLNIPQYTAGTGLSSDADFNTKGGTSAGLNLVAGAQYNTFLGYEAGKGGAVTNAADYNVAIGSFSLWSNTTGSRNVSIGNSSLYTNTTGMENVSIGVSSLSQNTGGSRNTAVGTTALQFNKTGVENVANGIAALSANTTGSINTAIGAYSLSANTTGSYNTANGHSSLTSNTIGSANTASGYYSLRFNTTGGSNTAIGNSSLENNLSGGGNSALGIESGKFISGGVNQNTSSNNSVYLGYSTKANADNGTNEIVIGYNTTGNGSNTTTIGTGNVLYVGGSSIAANSKVARFTNASGSCDITPVTGGISCSSDINLKKNITTFDGKEFALQTISNSGAEKTSLEKIMQITPVNYNWNAENNNEAKHVGFIAQEMEQIFGSIVSTDTKGTIDPITGKTIYLKSISYASITPYLVKGIQEMNLKIGDLQDITTKDQNKITLGSLIRSFLGDIGNGLEKIFVKEIDTKNLCVSDDSGAKTCLSKTQLDMLISKASVNNNSLVTDGSPSADSIPSDNDAAPNTPQTVVDLSAYNEVLNKVTIADYTTESWDVYQSIVSVNSMTEANTQEEINNAVSVILAAQENLVKVNP